MSIAAIRTTNIFQFRDLLRTQNGPSSKAKDRALQSRQLWRDTQCVFRLVLGFLGNHLKLTACVRTEDLLGTESDKIANPIVGSWFRIESGPEATPPKYEYDEVGVVIEGSYPSSFRPSFPSLANIGGSYRRNQHSG